MSVDWKQLYIETERHLNNTIARLEDQYGDIPLCDVCGYVVDLHEDEDADSHVCKTFNCLRNNCTDCAPPESIFKEGCFLCRHCELLEK